jgi:ABC-type Fe3+/spermidine/putrescine transport system ATPase subunit
MSMIEVVSVSKSFGGKTVVREVSFRVEEGQILCLLGPSGCGKTTLLRIVAGLETADAGYVAFDGRRLDEVPVHQRGFGLMFQDFALFPHKGVSENVAFGLRMQALTRQQVEARVAEMLDLVGLAGYEQRRVYDLSGGEQQRVALARSLAPGPRLLMLDEPLGSLDRALREGLMNELRAILKRVGVTSIYVTHDQQEAFAVSDQVIVLRQGSVVQTGSPQSVYRHPASPWVAYFLGLTNLVPGRVARSDPLEVDSPLGSVRLGEREGLVPGQEITLLIRPEAVRRGSECDQEGDLIVEGTVGECSFRGGHYRLVVRHESGLDLAFELTYDGSRLPERGQPITLAVRPEAIGLLTGGAREETTGA